MELFDNFTISQFTILLLTADFADNADFLDEHGLHE